MPLVLFGDEEPYEFSVAHARLIVNVCVGVAKLSQPVVVRSAAGDGSGEYPIDHFGGQSCRKSKRNEQKKTMRVRCLARAVVVFKILQ